MKRLVGLIFLLTLLLPTVGHAQSYNAMSYTTGSFNPGGCGGAGGVCSADLASFPIQMDGTVTYCKDCNPDCSAGGPGRWAFHQAGIWTCSIGGGGSSGCTDISNYLGPVSIAGNSPGGTDSISGVNIVIRPVTVGALGTCNSLTDGRMLEVTDNNAACAALAAPVAGGSTHCFVHCDATAWKIF